MSFQGARAAAPEVGVDGLCSSHKMNVGRLFQDVNISELMKKLDILGDNGVTISDRFLVSCSCLDAGVTLCGFCFVPFSFLPDLRDLLSTM